MDAQQTTRLVTSAVVLVAHVVVALAVVLVMRRRGPVWGPRAANASLITLALAFLGAALLVPAPTEERPFAETGPVGFMTLCAVVVMTTGLGSRLSRPETTADVRHATIAPRRLFVARVPLQRVAALVAGGTAFLAMAAASLMATDGETLVRGHGGASAVADDFPGWPALLPAVCTGLVLAAAAWWALSEIRDRPRIDEPSDTVLRARDASRVVRATAFGFAVTGSALLFSIGAHMNEVTQRLRSVSAAAPRSPGDVYQWTAFALYVPAIALVLVALGALAGSVGSREELDEATRPAADPTSAHRDGRADARTRA